MDIDRLSELLSDSTKKKQAVMDRYHSEISSFIKNEMISLREFHKITKSKVTYGYFERLYYRAKKKLGNTETTKTGMQEDKKTDTSKLNKDNSGVNKKITMPGISERLLSEISSCGFNEDDIKSWFNKNDLITSIKLRKKFDEIRWKIQGKFATHNINDFKA
ncbi:hypothetical protein [Photobacterium leiognathi]|uniref:hypothetical protein n=1 Tax=Photobacterium leiognathi TaxID=553611 RepID=UPI00298169D6|nr:hypothetical protein [Photobacterium leiognathi]